MNSAPHSITVQWKIPHKNPHSCPVKITLKPSILTLLYSSYHCTQLNKLYKKIKKYVPT